MRHPCLGWTEWMPSCRWMADHLQTQERSEGDSPWQLTGIKACPGSVVCCRRYCQSARNSPGVDRSHTHSERRVHLVCPPPRHHSPALCCILCHREPSTYTHDCHVCWGIRQLTMENWGKEACSLDPCRGPFPFQLSLFPMLPSGI